MSGFSFGTTQTTQPSLGFGFGNKPATAPIFGATTTSTTTTGFGTFPSTTSTGTSFGSTSAPSFSQSSFSFNPATTTTTSFLSSFQPSTNTFGSFGSSFSNNKLGQFSGGNSLFSTNQQPQQQQQQSQQQQQPQAIGSLFSPKIYNDERDNIVGLFNSIQAFWGTGKAYYSAFNPPYQFNDSDQFNRFKTICYSEIQTDDKDKEQKLFFLLKFIGDESQLKTNLLSYEQNFKQVIGNNHTVKLELQNVLPDSKAVISIKITENATSKVIPDSQLSSFLGQPNAKQQLNNVFCGNFLEILFLVLSKQELDAYLNIPPKGIDERIWVQSKLENPDPSRFIPLPLIGFNSLNNRFKMQEKEIQQQQMRLKQIIDNVTSLESDISQFKAKFEECRRRQLNLSYQVLKKMIAQEVQRKRTLPIQAEEDKLRASLEAIQSELNVPTKFQGCLNELMSQLRQMQCQALMTNSIALDQNAFSEYKQFLEEENDGIMNLVELLKKDVDDINRLSK